MAAPAKVNLVVYQGSTFNEVLRWESNRKVYKSISAITNAAPVIITAAAHGIPEGWRFRVTNVLGMKEINSAADAFYTATINSANEIEINNVNSLGYSAYTSGGVVEYNEPVDLAGYTARLQIRNKITDVDFLLELTTENGGISIDNVDKTISITISATNTALIDWTAGVYSLELVSGTGVVSTLMTGSVSVKQEVTR